MHTYLHSWRNLSSSGKRLALAIILYGVFSPVLSLIMNVYFWRKSEDIQAVILFNGVAFLLLPLVNYLSGLAMKAIPPKNSFAFSFLLIAISPLILFFQDVGPYTMAVIMGVIYAFSRGIFFSNRNFLEINLTEDGQRNFYVSLTSFFNETLSIAVPFFTGWFVVFGEKLDLYSITSAYYYLEALVIIFALATAAFAAGIDSRLPRMAMEPKRLLRVSPRWRLMRKVFVIHGLSNGLSQFMPLLIGMIVFKSEGILGNISLLSSLFTMVVLAWWGKGARMNQRASAVMLGAFAMALGSFAVSIYNQPGVMVYKMLYSVGSSIFYMGLKPLEFEVIENEGKNARQDFTFFLDESIFLNLGRVLGISLCFSLAWTSPKAALIGASVITGALQLINVYLLKGEKRGLRSSFGQIFRRRAVSVRNAILQPAPISAVRRLRSHFPASRHSWRPPGIL